MEAFKGVNTGMGWDPESKGMRLRGTDFSMNRVESIKFRRE